MCEDIFILDVSSQVHYALVVVKGILFVEKVGLFRKSWLVGFNTHLDYYRKYSFGK
jgi:hypothetical protein